MKIHENIPEDWMMLLSKVWPHKEILKWSEQLSEWISKENTTPAKNAIFKALELCTVEKTKVVILGQDPYPTHGHANGLAFSTEDFVQPFPKSLVNIFKELKRSLPEYDYPLTGNLTTWAEQGVLLLNTCLTTKIGQANAHQNKGWEEMTSRLVEQLFQEKEGLVGMFWGKQAQNFASIINKSDHLILETSHPSPLSVYRGFEGCGHFTMCNSYLEKKGEKPILWQT